MYQKLDLKAFGAVRGARQRLFVHVLICWMARIPVLTGTVSVFVTSPRPSRSLCHLLQGHQYGTVSLIGRQAVATAVSVQISNLSLTHPEIRPYL